MLQSKDFLPLKQQATSAPPNHCTAAKESSREDSLELSLSGSNKDHLMAVWSNQLYVYSVSLKSWEYISCSYLFSSKIHKISSFVVPLCATFKIILSVVIVKLVN